MLGHRSITIRLHLLRPVTRRFLCSYCGHMLGGRAAWLGRPWFFAAVVVLALNDHVMKAAWPGWVTGKLSDVAGLVVVATLVSVVCGPTLGTTLAGVGFVALKTVPGVAESVAPVLGGVTLRDMSDLVALLALPVLWWMLRRQRSDQRRRTRRGWQALGLVGAVLVTTATSQSPGDRIEFLWFEQDAFYASLQLARGEVFLRSADGGATWIRMDELPDGVSEPKRRADDVVCAPRRTCYRIGWDFEHVAGQSTAHGYTTIERRVRDGEWTQDYRFAGETALFGPAINPEHPDQAVIGQYDSSGVTTALRRVGSGEWVSVDLVTLAGGRLQDAAARQREGSAGLVVMAVIVVLPWLVVGAAVLTVLVLVLSALARRSRGRGFDPPTGAR